MAAAIRVEQLSKSYRISHLRRDPYVTLRETLTNQARAMGRRFRGRTGSGSAPGTTEEFWALQDVSFEIAQGERVGIIGRNGAGKSTLLKILSRITEPTRGRVVISGRAASLLEVGTGFHPELTGRENIFLNGAVLGMRRGEIQRKFDEIVAFAEVERFLDTPVKRYSSGMYVRLAFAVAAHLDPDILVIDEVLAVGDVQFQRKCLRKMQDAGRDGRTVLFVSHNMQTMRSLCSRAILLSAGKVAGDGIPSQIVSSYLQCSEVPLTTERINAIIESLPHDPVFRLVSVRLIQDDTDARQHLVRDRPFQVEARYVVSKRTVGLRIYFDLYDDQETPLFRSFHDVDGDSVPVTEPGEYTSRATVPAYLLGPLQYSIRLRAGIFGVRLLLPEDGIPIPFSVELEKPYCPAYPGATFSGKLWLDIAWSTRREKRPTEATCS